MEDFLNLHGIQRNDLESRDSKREKCSNLDSTIGKSGKERIFKIFKKYLKHLKKSPEMTIVILGST